jgi:hypothetical protein
MSQFPDFSRIPRRWLFIALGLVVIAIAAWSTRGKLWGKPDPLLVTPTLALQALQAKTLYFNSAALSALTIQRPDLITTEDRFPDSDRARAFAQAVRNPKLFWQLDRQHHFDALLLTGDPSEYRALLDNLVETKVWQITYVDHTSLVFRRDGTKPWELSDFAPVRARLKGLSHSAQATALAQAATKLIAARRMDDARQMLDDATKLDSRNPQVANGLAVFYVQRGEWRDAWKQVELALSADGKYLPALATKTQLLYGSKRYGEAYEISKDLIARLPEDPNLLFYHAKIAHEAHAYGAEIEALVKLIARANAEGRPVGGYQIYLGQAYASQGDAPNSIDSFMLALNDPDLPDDQRAFARENIVRIKKKTGQ